MTSTQKPDGTSALIPGLLPGCMPSPAPSQFYWRTMRISSHSPLVEVCKKNGYKIEYNLNIDELKKGVFIAKSKKP